MEQLQKLGAQINIRRTILGLTQIDLATLAAVSDATIRYIEKGKPGVAIGHWIKVADIVGLDLILATKKMSDATRKSV